MEKIIHSKESRLDMMNDRNSFFNHKFLSVEKIPNYLLKILPY